MKMTREEFGNSLDCLDIDDCLLLLKDDEWYLDDDGCIEFLIDEKEMIDRLWQETN